MLYWTKERGVDMTFQQLQYFLEVHKAGTFSQAAKNLFVTPSSISIIIGNMEKELGYPLFIRSQKGLTLTASGEKVLDLATHICEKYRQLGDIRGTSRIALRIAINDYTPAKAAVTRLIANNIHNQDTSITITKATPQTMQKIALLETDIGIIGNFHSRNIPLKNILKDKGLAYRVLDITPIEIVIGKDHRLFHTDTIHASDLENEVYIDSATRSFSQSDYLKGIVNISREKVIAVHHADIRFALLSQGIGYTLSRRPPDAICSQYGLRCIPIEDVYTEILCITNPSRPLNDTGKQFLSLLDAEIEKQKSRL